jgi:membrane fusion protein, multidrug efflux system
MTIKRLLWWLIPIFLLLAVGGFVMSKLQQKKAEEATQKAAKAKAEDLDTPKQLVAGDWVAVGQTRFTQSLAFTGSLEATQSAVLRSKVGGQILSAVKREGDAVKKGELLATLDSIDLSTRLTERDALRQQVAVQLDTARKSLQSQRDLFNKGFISQNALDASEGNVRVLEANLNATQAQLALAQQAMKDVNLTSPITGVISKRHAEIGDRLMAEQPIYTVIDNSRLEIASLLPVEEAAKLKLGAVLEGTIANQSAQPITATLNRFAPQVAAGGARVVEIRAAVNALPAASGKPLLSVGSFVNGAIKLGDSEPLRTVSSQTLRGVSVWMVRDGRVAEQAVKLGKRSETLGVVEVIDGLKEGDKVLLNKVQDLKLGQKVSLG